MKRYITTMLAALLLSGMMMCAWGYGMPKREFRSAWYSPYVPRMDSGISLYWYFIFFLPSVLKN